MPYTTSVTSTSRKSVLLGTSALVCLALAAPVMADDFVITSGTTTNDGNTINGNDTVTLTGALVVSNISSTIISGINASGGTNEVSVTASGSITTAGDYSRGIFDTGGSDTIIMSGSISTIGKISDGINSSGGSSKITMSGSISTTGDKSRGIYAAGGSSEITISGTISTTGNTNSHGIWTYLPNNTITVSGSIATTGNDSHGIYNQSNNNTINMSGSISTTGNDSYGIRHRSDDNTTTISGSVTSTGTASSALMNSDGSGGTFILDEGAVIIGDITALADTQSLGYSPSTNNKLKFNLGRGASYAYSVGGAGAGAGVGQWTFTDQDGRTPIATTSGANCISTGVTVCNLVTGVSTGNLEVQDELQFSMNSSMIGSLLLGSSNSAAPVEAMSFAQTPQNSTWANVYGDTSERSASTTKLAFDGSNRGLTIGTPVSINDTLNLDMVFNASNANLDIGSFSEQQITARSYNLGAVLRDLAPATGWAVDAFGFVGRNSYDGTRKVMNNDTTTGSETVTAAYSGSEALVGFDAQYSNPINDTLNFKGGLNASLSNEKIGAYSESKYYAWDARTMTQATGGITAGLEYQKDALTTFASLGLQRSSLKNGKTATYTNNGTAASFTDSSTGDTRRSVTVGFDYAGSESMTFSGAVEAFTSTGGVSGNSASLSANWKF